MAVLSTGEWRGAMERLGVPGLAVVVVEGDGTSLCAGFGQRDAASELPVTEDTTFYVASSTKSFVAKLVVDEPAIALDERVAAYLPDLPLGAVTIRELLTHRAGIHSWPITRAEAYTGEIDDMMFRRLIADVTPTGSYGYDNLHYTILGRVVEAATGVPWKVRLATHVFAPLGMDATTRATSGERGAALAHGPDGSASRFAKTDRTMHAAGGVCASARDLERWLRFLLGDDARPLLERHVTTDPHAASHFTRDGYALGWFLSSYRGHRVVAHPGGYSGWRSFVAILPERRLGVAVLANLSLPAPWLVEAVAGDVLDSVLGESRTFGERVDAMLAEREALLAALPKGTPGRLTRPAHALCGRFHHPSWGTLELRAEGGALRAFFGGVEKPLLPDGDDRFLLLLAPQLAVPLGFEGAGAARPVLGGREGSAVFT